jgi:hypothetical protein
MEKEEELMSRSQNLLKTLLWGVPRNHQKQNPKVCRLYELESGILKICTAIELLQKTLCKEGLDVVRQELLSTVQNSPPVDNYANRIESLERELDQTVTSLESINSNSKRLKLLRLYITSLRYGSFTSSSAIHKPGELPMRK